MTINERVKMLRKSKKWSQTFLAKKLGVTQSGISYMEQVGSSIAEPTIIALSSIFGVTEEWLRHGTEPMCAQTGEGENLDSFLRTREMSELEKTFLKAYFELEPDVRHNLIQHFKERVLNQLAQEESASEKEARLLRQEADAVEHGGDESSASPVTKEA